MALRFGPAPEVVVISPHPVRRAIETSTSITSWSASPRKRCVRYTASCWKSPPVCALRRFHQADAHHHGGTGADLRQGRFAPIRLLHPALRRTAALARRAPSLASKTCCAAAARPPCPSAWNSITTGERCSSAVLIPAVRRHPEDHRLLSLMAQSACPCPRLKPNSPSSPRFLADIGDYQSIQENLSTFSAHVSNIREMALDVTPDSLVAAR